MIDIFFNLIQTSSQYLSVYDNKLLGLKKNAILTEYFLKNNQAIEQEKMKPIDYFYYKFKNYCIPISVQRLFINKVLLFPNLSFEQVFLLFFFILIIFYIKKICFEFNMHVRDGSKIWQTFIS